tara:strand:+ start:1700 stop:2044 length:345 start_codon:yes stop_codon:yes gene_type:complete
MESSYYNTNTEQGSELTKSNEKAKSQEEKILKIFKIKNKLSASEAWAIYDNKINTPITSIRRAITNLCSDGELFKTNEKIIGIYGKKEHIYMLNKSSFFEEKPNQLTLFNQNQT